MSLPPLILVADDNRNAADSLSHIFRGAGYRVRTVYDGRQALEVAAEALPDVLVLDIAMPGLTGYEVARAFARGAAAGAKRPLLIAVTAWGREGDKLRAQFAGLDHHFTKPLDPGVLLEVLAKVPTVVDPTPQRVLVADDNQDWANEMVDLLRGEGYMARAAYDGRQALDIASTFSPQIVILDARMPGMTGHDAARVFKRHPRETRPLLIAVSAHEEEREAAANAGFDHFVRKPFEPAALRKLFTAHGG